MRAGSSSTAADDGIGERLAVMDGSRVERQVLSMSAATPYLDDRSARGSRRAVSSTTSTPRCAATHPDRFGFFATLPMPHVDAALEEIRRAFDELGAMGVTFTTSINARSLADPAFAAGVRGVGPPRRRSCSCIRPGSRASRRSSRESGLTWPLGAPVEDAVCAMQLVRAGFPKRYPQLKIILPHLGGFLPFLRYRLDKAGQRRAPGADPPSVQMRKFWYDTRERRAATRWRTR